MSAPVGTPDASRTSPDDGAPGRRGRGGRLYGASLWHLAALLGGFAVAAYAVSRLRDDPALLRMAIWFVGAALVWDLVVGPLIALADRGLRPLRSRPRPVAMINHVRVPALTSALLLLVWAPVIFQRSEQVFRVKAGLGLDPYLGRWIAITVVLFAVSALVYGIRWARVSRSGSDPAQVAVPAGQAAPSSRRPPGT